uniref:RRM domain-containing protein n=1 Tax=Timema genevievae TaxID=629358 RepID=A0A7R9K5F9_TIMGE|nr:unnamed protein product [Timema genevievae]
MIVQEDTVFVSGMSPHMTEEDIAQHFGSIGVIKTDRRTMKPKIWMYKDKLSGKPKGEATVTYDDSNAAKSAIDWFDGKDFKGSVIKVQIAQHKNNYAAGGRGGRGGGGGGRGGGGGGGGGGMDRGGRGGGRDSDRGGSGGGWFLVLVVAMEIGNVQTQNVETPISPGGRNATVVTSRAQMESEVVTRQVVKVEEVVVAGWTVEGSEAVVGVTGVAGEAASLEEEAEEWTEAVAVVGPCEEEVTETAEDEEIEFRISVG